jgi:hypothetical protein
MPGQSKDASHELPGRGYLIETNSEKAYHRFARLGPSGVSLGGAWVVHTSNNKQKMGIGEPKRTNKLEKQPWSNSLARVQKEGCTNMNRSDCMGDSAS